MIKLAIFDLDGTLVDSLLDLTNALNHAIYPFEENYGLARLEPARTRELVGEGITKLIEKMLGPEKQSIRQDVADRFMEFYSSHLTDFTRPYEGTREMLETLSSVRKAVVSNKREELSRRVLGDLGLLKYFDVVFGSDSTPEKKPLPGPLLRVMSILRCGPEDTIMIGDSMFDITAGRAAGVRTVAASYGFRDRTELLSADFMIDAIEELPRLIEGMK